MTKWRWIVMVGLAGLTLAGCGAADEAQQAKVQANLTEALRAAQNGDAKDARKWADRAIAARPDDVHTYASPPPQGGFNTDTDPANDGQGLSVEDVFQAVGDDKALVDYMSRAARKFPQSDWPLLPLEDAQGRLGDAAGRVATAQKIVALMEARVDKPKSIPNAMMLIRLAQAYFDAGDAVKGAAAYHRVIDTFAFDPRSYDAMNGLAYAWAVANDTPHLPEAATLAAKALAKAQSLARDNKMSDESVGAVQDTLGWVEYRQKNYRAALSDLQQAMNADPREAENRYHLGMVYKATTNTEGARAEFLRATLLSPGYADAAKELASLPPAS